MFQKLIDKISRQDEDTFHFRVSLAKSVLRIVAGLSLVLGSLGFAGVAFILAEVLGIVEEL